MWVTTDEQDAIPENIVFASRKMRLLYTTRNIILIFPFMWQKRLLAAEKTSRQRQLYVTIYFVQSPLVEWIGGRLIR